MTQVPLWFAGRRGGAARVTSAAPFEQPAAKYGGTKYRLVDCRMTHRPKTKLAAATLGSHALDADQDGAPPPFQQVSFAGHAGVGFDNGTDLTITIDNPYVVGEGMRAHTIYHLSYKTSRSDLSNPSADLVRRFSDFVWLHECLCERYPGRFVPALPDKFPVQSLVHKVQQNSPFLSERCRALHRFMNRLARHPFLSRSKEFTSFLQVPQSELSLERQQQEEQKVTAAGGGFLGTAWNFMGTALTGVKQASQRVIMGSKVSLPNDPKISAISDYVSNLEGIVADMRRLLEELHHKRTEFGTAFFDLGTCLTAFSNLEEIGGPLKDPLHECAAASSKAGHLLLSKKDDTADVSDLPQEMLRQARQHHFDISLMLASIDDFIRVIAGARDCIRRRYDIAQNERELSEELARKKQYSSITDAGELEMKIEEERQRLNSMASVIDEEMAWFSNVKQIEIDWVLHKLIDCNLQLGDMLATSWRPSQVRFYKQRDAMCDLAAGLASQRLVTRAILGRIALAHRGDVRRLSDIS